MPFMCEPKDETHRESNFCKNNRVHVDEVLCPASCDHGEWRDSVNIITSSIFDFQMVCLAETCKSTDFQVHG